MNSIEEQKLPDFISETIALCEKLKECGEVPTQIIINPKLLEEPYRTPFLAESERLGLTVKYHW